MKKIQIMIAEDHPIFLDMLVQGLSRENMSVIGTATNGEVLINLVKENIPDVVVLDLNMPIMDGHAVLKHFNLHYKGIRTIILSSDYSPYFIANAIIDGAAGYLTKGSFMVDVVKAVEDAYSEGYYFNDLISKEVLHQLRDDKKKLYYLIDNQKFSEREIEILKLFCAEVPFAQIADRLAISPNTVLDHKKNIYKKTDSNNIVSLVKYAIKQGIIAPKSI